MIALDITNYEGFLLDYFEGNLTPEQITALQAFAAKHPELGIDLNDTPFIPLSFEEETTPVFENKNSLKKNTLVVDENLAFEYIENQLSTEAKLKFENELKSNPTLAKELALYQQTLLSSNPSLRFELKSELYYLEGDAALLFNYTENTVNANERKLIDERVAIDENFAKHLSSYQQAHLQADLSIVYPDKKSLKQKEATIIPLFNWRYVSSIAASVALVIGLYVVLKDTTTQVDPKAKLDKDTIQTKTPQQPVLENAVEETMVAQSVTSPNVKGKTKVKKSIIRQSSKDTMIETNSNLANAIKAKDKKIKTSIIRQYGKDTVTETNSGLANAIKTKDKKIKNSIIRQYGKDTLNASNTGLANTIKTKDKKIKTSIIREYGKDTTQTNNSNLATNPKKGNAPSVITPSVNPYTSELVNTKSKEKTTRLTFIPEGTDQEEVLAATETNVKKKGFWSRALKTAGQLNNLGLKSVNGDEGETSDLLSFSGASVELKKSK
jgi:hypothetical protein